MENEFRVGVVTKTHGLKGEVKVHPTTDDVNRYKKLKKVFYYNNNEKNSLDIESVRFFKNQVIVKFVNYNRIEDVEALIGIDLMIDRGDATPLEADEFYIGDVIGSNVFDTEGNPLGKVIDVIPTGANEVFVIDNNGKSLMIPSVKEFIKKLDVENQELVVKLMDGML